MEGVESTPSQAVVSQKRLHDLVAEIDPKQILDEDVEELLMQMADDFIEGAVKSACQLAKHRKSTTLETKDLQLYLERSWNMIIPGFGSEDHSQKKTTATESHKQRVNIIKKSKR